MSEPRFLSIGQIDVIHARGLAAHGGLEGTREQANPMALYDPMIAVAEKQLDRKGLAVKFRALFL